MRFRDKWIVWEDNGRQVGRWLVQPSDPVDGLDLRDSTLAFYYGQCELVNVGGELHYREGGYDLGAVVRTAIYGNAASDVIGYTLSDADWVVMTLDGATYEYPVGVVDVANDQIVIPETGLYSITYRCEMDFSGATEIEIGMFNNGVLLEGTLSHVSVSQQQRETGIGRTLYASALAGETIDVRVRAPGGTAEFEVDDITLSVARIGAEAPPPGAASIW